MKEAGEKAIDQKKADDATINFVSRQAQEAILDPNLPEFYKDYVLEAAIGTILKIAEKRSAYDARSKETKGREQTIYEANTKEP
jgi:hypothetical protein